MLILGILVVQLLKVYLEKPIQHKHKKATLTYCLFFVYLNSKIKKQLKLKPWVYSKQAIVQREHGIF